MQTKYISTTETAKIIRQELAKAFPGIKFSVKSKSYSGGSSIDVGWTDGPTPKMVEKITGQFSGASFDAMIDLKSYRDSKWNGEAVHFGADYIFTHRANTAEFLQQVADRTAKQWGVSVPVIEVDSFGYILNYEMSNGRVGGGYFTLTELIMQDARKTLFHNGLRCIEK